MAKKALIVILLIVFLFIGLVGVIGADGYLTYTGMMERSDEFSAGTPTFDVGSDNKTISISITIESPKLGFLPKSIKLIFEIYKGTDLVDSAEDTIVLGEESTAEFVVVLTDDDATTIAGGGTITVTLKIKASPVIFGFDIGGVVEQANIDLAEETINIEK